MSRFFVIAATVFSLLGRIQDSAPRFGRPLTGMLNAVNLLRERGVQVRSISDGIDPATSTGRLMLNMLAALAE